MKTRSFFTLAIIGCALARTAIAQPAIPPAADPKAISAAFDAALAAVQAGDIGSAQLAIAATNIQRPNTLEADIESATKLVHLAFFLRQKLDYANASLIARQALKQLTTGVAARGGSAVVAHRAQAYEVVGLIYEQLLVDADAAKSAYQHAQQLNSASNAAAAGLSRIHAEEDAKARGLGQRG